MNEPDKLNDSDQIMLERIEKIIAGQLTPASSMDELCYRLAKTQAAPNPLFQKQLENRLAQELAARQEFFKAENKTAFDPAANPVQAEQTKNITALPLALNKRNLRLTNWAFFTRKPRNNPTATTKRTGWPWQNIILTAMALITVTIILAVIGLAIFNLGANSSISGSNAQPASNQTTKTTGSNNTAALNRLLVLQPAFPKVTDEQLEAARQILQQRATSLGLSQVTAKVDKGKLILEIPPDEDKTILANKFAEQLKIIGSTGRLEFVSSTNTNLAINDLIQTTYCTTGTIINPKPGLCSTTAPKAGQGQNGILNSNGQPFQTLFTNDQIEPDKVEQLKNPDGSGGIQFELKTSALDTFKKYLSDPAANPAVSLDRRVITVLTAKEFISNQGLIVIKGGNLPESKLPAETVLPIIIKFGPLPFEVEVVSG